MPANIFHGIESFLTEMAVVGVGTSLTARLPENQEDDVDVVVINPFQSRIIDTHTPSFPLYI